MLAFPDRIYRIGWIFSFGRSPEERDQTPIASGEKPKLKTIKYLSFPQPLRLNLKNNLWNPVDPVWQEIRIESNPHFPIRLRIIGKI